MKINISSDVKRAVSKGLFKIKKNSPTILIVAGVAGAVASTVLACKATLKVNDVLEETQLTMDIIHKASNIYGDSKRPSPGGSSIVPATKIGWTNYARPVGSYSSPYSARPEQRPHSVYAYDQVVFETRSDAMSVLDVLDNIAGEFQIVRVSELYDAAGIKNFDYTAENFGWRESDISAARIERVRDGYIIDLPKPLNIK